MFDCDRGYCSVHHEWAKGLPFAEQPSKDLPMPLTWFKNAGNESGFFWYATALIFVSLLFYVFMPDMKRHSRMEQHA